MLPYHRHFCFSYCIFLVILFTNSQKLPYDSGDHEFTIAVAPGLVECFYQKVKSPNVLELEYQVIDANFGETNFNQELDISFQLFSPTGRELISDYKQSDANHRVEVKEDGEYKICFDNRHSRFSTKTIYFEVFIDTDADDDKMEDYDFFPEMMYNDTMDQIKSSIAKVKEDLSKVKHHQDTLKAIESRDRNLQEHNFTSVNRFSMLIIVVMLVVGAVQVVMVRSLFEEHSKLHKVFKLLS